MATVTDLVFDEQFGHLLEVAAHRPWDLTRIDGPGFILALPARDRSLFFLNVTCSDYPALPPIWSWYNQETKMCHQPSDIPKGEGGYFHGSGRICAPWNRIAYRQEDPMGPHKDWQLANWLSNPKTIGCTTLAAMALRMAVELVSPKFRGRQG